MLLRSCYEPRWGERGPLPPTLVLSMHHILGRGPEAGPAQTLICSLTSPHGGVLHAHSQQVRLVGGRVRGADGKNTASLAPSPAEELTL